MNSQSFEKINKSTESRIETDSQINSIFNETVKQSEEDLLRNEIAHQVEAAKIAAAQDGGRTSWHIKKYGITDQEALIEIAKIAAAQNGGGTSAYIQNYGIKDEKALIEIAKIAAAQSGLGTTAVIKNYGIAGEKTLIKIAKIAAAQDGGGTSKYIQNYGITDEKALIEIAKIAAAQDGRGTSKYIQNYGITHEIALIEIAKIAAAQDGWGLSIHIQNFEISCQDALIEIAKIAAAQDGGGTSMYIRNYGIAAEKALIEIAKIAAAHDGWGISRRIQEYGITDKTALIEIAKIAAAQHGGGISQHIQNYVITRQDTLIEIGKIAAEQDGGGTSMYIQNYGITVEKALIEIGKIAAAQDGRGTSKHIQEFGITGENALIEIAKIAAAKDGEGTSKYIQNYGIKDQDALFEICRQLFFSILVGSEENDLATRLINYVQDWRDSPHLKNVCNDVSTLIEHREVDSQELKAQLTAQLTEGLLVQFPQLNVEVSQFFERVLNTNTLRWCFAVRYLLLNDISEADLKMLIATGLLEEIEGYRDPKMRFTLLKLVIQLLKTPEAKAEFEPKLEKIKMKSTKYLKGILSLYYVLLKVQKIDVNAIDRVIEFTQKKFYYSDFTKQRKLIAALNIVTEDTFLTPGQKACLLGYVFLGRAQEKADQRQLTESYKQVQALIGLAGFSHLKAFRDNPESPAIMLEKKFKAAVPFGDVPDFADRFNAEITSSRSPTAALTYAGVVSKLPSPVKEKVLAAYGTFINWVLNKNYSEHRYDLEKQGSHLLAVFKNRPELLKAWRKGSEISFEELMGDKQNTKEFNYSFSEVLVQKILTDKHLNAEDYPLLAAFLNSPSTKVEESDSEVEKLLIELASIEINKETEKSAEHKITEASSLIDKLLEMNKSPEKFFPVQFKNDLEDMKKQSKSLLSHSSHKGFEVVDTDRPVEMLLCGTDVSGSCQRVDGNPDLNKCLVAYLIDGKNRMIAIKNDEGTIVARSILRIMLNTNTLEPVLLLERVYQAGANKSLAEGVVAFAKMRAQELNLPLVSTEIKGNDYFDSPICSLGSCAPYEYVDSAKGIQKNGIFTISPQSLYFLFTPLS